MNHSDSQARAPGTTGKTRASSGCARLFLTSVLLGVACNNEPASTAVTLTLDPGLEAETWSAAPTPAEVVVLGVRNGSSTQLARASWPVSSLDLGELPEGSAWSFRVELRDASGALALLGLSPPLAPSLIAGREVPVHCGRVGTFSRVASGLNAGWASPALALVADRYVFVGGKSAGSSAAPSELYDLAALAPLLGQAALPRVPRHALASRSGMLVLLDETGGTALDLTTGASSEIDASLLGDASGGVTLGDGDGGAFLVGATRSDGAATGTVLHLDASGKLTRLALGVPRRRAAATRVEGLGLVIAGGEAEASVEILPGGAGAFVSTGLLLPSIAGAALAPLSSSEALLLGGAGPDQTPAQPIRFSLECSGGCPAPTPRGAHLHHDPGPGLQPRRGQGARRGRGGRSDEGDPDRAARRRAPRDRRAAEGAAEGGLHHGTSGQARAGAGGRG